nr:MAG TPA: hypothetical protein [Caudoviricetes sp.]
MLAQLNHDIGMGRSTDCPFPYKLNLYQKGKGKTV